MVVGVVGAVGWRDRLLETAPVSNRFLPSSDLLQKPGEERRGVAAYLHTCDPRVCEKTSPRRGCLSRSISRTHHDRPRPRFAYSIIYFYFPLDDRR